MSKMFAIRNFLIVLLVFGLHVKAQTSRSYEINSRGILVGYIEWSPPEKTNYQGKKASSRKSITVVQYKNQGRVIERKVEEQTLYYNSRYQIFSYNLQYQDRNDVEERRYSFNDQKLSVTVLRNGRRVFRRERALRPGIHIITDYFSFLPLLRRQNRPLSLFALDPKQIQWGDKKLPIQKLVIPPQGERNLTIRGKQYFTKLFFINWGSTVLKYWIAKQNNSLVQIKAPAVKTLISLADESIKHKFATASSSLPRHSRPLPFKLGNSYSYKFLYLQKQVGAMKFQIRKNGNSQYKLLVKGNLKTTRIPYKFYAKTIYDNNWQPLKYRIREKTYADKILVDILCEFVPKGVKERFQRKEHILEGYFTLPEEFVLFENNGIPNLAITLSQLPFERNIALPIFHPRRLDFLNPRRPQCSEGILSIKHKAATHIVCPHGDLSVEHKDKAHVVLQLKTRFYTFKLWVSPQGKLLQYAQGKLRIVLQDN